MYFFTWKMLIEYFFYYIYFMLSSRKRLDNAYKKAKIIEFNDHSKFILFSDCHRGDNSFADDFANNRNIYFHALHYYFANHFTYCELGYGDELWENLSLKSIFDAHQNDYFLMKKCYMGKTDTRKAAMSIMFGAFLYLPIVQISLLLDKL